MRRSRSGEERLTTLAPLLRPAVTWAERNGVFFAFVLLCLIFALSDSSFYRWSNLSLILLQISVVGIIAVPQAMLILTGHVDLAVGSVMVLAAMVFGSLMKSEAPLGLAVVAAMGVALAWGLVDAVAPPDRLDLAVEGFAASILAGGPHAIRLQKRLILDWEELPTGAAVARGIEIFTEAYETDEPRQIAGARLAAMRARREGQR